ncbi:MAG: septal ring lytic transglycosylase RlpA family protein [Rhodospirillales bacterium]|nr:septal ring lytic transglycosylase RlpA family protein [Rhodospirillales bacterium]
MRAAVAIMVLTMAALSASGCGETKTAPEPRGRFKVGKPYEVSGKWYHPRVDYGYDEVGIASWYGPGFDGKMTANGETYDMNGLTAAHPTLPLPSVVQVTNLENGRSLKLTINDRGPFAYDRIIDVSRRGAQLLGFMRQGTARVRVQVVADETRELHARLVGHPVAVTPPVELVAKADASALATRALNTEQLVGYRRASPAEQIFAGLDTAPPTQRLPAQPTAASDDAGSPGYYVQAGAYAHRANAEQVVAQLNGLGSARISTVQQDGGALHRVRLGPVPTAEQADQLLDAAIDNGFVRSRVVLE